MNEVGDPVEYRDDTIDRLTADRDAWRTIADQLAAALRIVGACPRCKGEGQVEFHARGVHREGERGECPSCGGRRYLLGPMAALGAYEAAKKMREEQSL